jgi:hypothetical protein
MNTVYKYFIIIAVLLFAACDKETEGLSTTTIPCELTLDGSAITLVEVNSQYAEPGYEAVEDSADVTGAVVVSGTLNTNAIGRYTLRYTVKNKDGVPTIAKRTVIVFDPSSPTGFYKVSSESYRDNPPSQEYASEPTVLIYQEESGAYFVSDLFGGYYSVGRGYGEAYETGGTVKIGKTGAVSLVSSRRTPWGDEFSKVEGTYDSSALTFELDIDWEAGYTFHLKFVKITE